MWAISEAALGIMAGVAVSFITDSLTLGAQVLSLQAGYAYASTIDPSTQADSGILVILAQLLGGLLFFCFGLDRLVIHAMAASLESYPPGTFTLARPFAQEIIRLGAGMFTTAIRLALPVIALLAMIDIAIALLGRISPQMQVISVAFPVKMLVALLVLASVLVVAPSLYESYAHRVLGTVRTLILQR
jgi:flagellar biosynthesis protein FliR